MDGEEEGVVSACARMHDWRGRGGKCEHPSEKAVDPQPIASLMTDVWWKGFQ